MKDKLTARARVNPRNIMCIMCYKAKGESPEKRLFYHGAHGVHRELIKKNSVLFARPVRAERAGVISVVSFFSGL
jgi:hypothetical protein